MLICPSGSLRRFPSSAPEPRQKFGRTPRQGTRRCYRGVSGLLDDERNDAIWLRGLENRLAVRLALARSVELIGETFGDASPGDVSTENLFQVGDVNALLDVRAGFDLMTARAVGSPIEMFKLAGRALHPGGVLMLYVSAAQNFDAAPDAAGAAGLVDASVASYDLRHGKQVMNRAVATWRRK